MAIAMTLVCFAGFAPSYYLKGYFGNAASIKPWVHFHGLVFIGWIVLLIAQTQLLAHGRARVDRQLGVIGAGLALLMIITGAGAAYLRGTTITPGVPQEFVLGFLAITISVLLVFPGLIGLALYLRQPPAAHQRLMLLATTAILPAAVQRLLMFSLRARGESVDILRRHRRLPPSPWPPGISSVVAASIPRRCGAGLRS
jgi:hypothetical protein